MKVPNKKNKTVHEEKNGLCTEINKQHPRKKIFGGDKKSTVKSAKTSDSLRKIEKKWARKQFQPAKINQKP